MTTTNKFTIFKDFNEIVSSKMRVSGFDTIIDIIEGKNPDLQVATITEQIAAEPDKDKQTELKKKLPFLTVSSCYDETATSKEIYPTQKDSSGKDILDEKGNKIKGEIQLNHSGFVCMDFDHLTDVQMVNIGTTLESWDTTILLHTSPRGKGIKVYFSVTGIDIDNHTNMYTAFMLHLYEKLEVLSDTSCTNVNRGTFLPYQPLFYYNPNYSEVNGIELLREYPNAHNKVKELSKILKKGGILPADVKIWDLNKKVVTTKKKEYTTTGVQVPATTTSLLSNQDKFDKYVDHIVAKTGLPDGENGSRHDFYLKLVNLKSEGIEQSKILQMAIDWTANNKELIKPYTEQEIRDYLGRSLRDEKGFEIPNYVFFPKENQRSSKDKVTIKDVRNIMSQYYDFYYDNSSDRYYYSDAGNKNPFDFKMFTEQDKCFNGWLELLEDHHIFVPKPYLACAVMNNNTYQNQSYIGSQLDWLHAHYDGQDHLNPLLKTVTTDDDTLFQITFTKWCVALVSQILSEEQFSRNDNALIFISPQNMGKTGFFERLLWNFDLYASKPNFNFESTKDALMLNEKVLILLDEMSSYSKGDVKQMKHFFSQSKITGDRKYQQTADYKRYATFAGCANNRDISKDDTGERRLLIFDLLRYDKTDFNKVDKNQFWGQIVDLYKKGFDYKFTSSEVTNNMKRNAENYSIHKPEDTFIETYLTVSHSEVDFMSNTVLEKLINEYTKEFNVKSFINPSVIKAKLETMGINTQKVKKVGGKTMRGIEGIRDWKRVVNPNLYPEHQTEKKRPILDFDFNTEDREFKEINGKTLSSVEQSSFDKLRKAGGLTFNK